MNVTKTIDLANFKESVGFTLLMRRWGNRRQGNIDKIKTSEDPKQDEETKKQLKLVKELIVCDEYDAICSFQGGLRTWVYDRTVPSFFREGFQLTKLEGIEVIEARLKKAQIEQKVLVEALAEIFPIKVEEARGSLGRQFKDDDYPSAEDLIGMFSISWNWIAFTVPDGLPPELRQQEQDKLERQFADAGEQIMVALRASFQELVAHASRQLQQEPGEKKKVIRESLIGNVQQFISTFSQRNLMNDVELQKLVNQAQAVLVDVTPQKLREYEDARKNVSEEFAKINAELSKMVVERKSRKFEFEEAVPQP